MKIIKQSRFVLLFVVILILSGCGSSSLITNPPLSTAQIIERGLIDVFEEGLNDSDGDTVNCEASAIVYDGSNIVIASDKPIPGDSHSPVFSIQYRYSDTEGLSKDPITFLTASPFITAVKYEDMTVTPDGNYVIASTGFDRVKPDTSEWDSYNTMLIWPVADSTAVKVVSPTTRDGVTSSVSLREKISAVLTTDTFPDGVPYFKIEGLAAIPGNKLLLGVRELGENYMIFDYAIKIVCVSYTITNDELNLSDDYELIYNYDPSQITDLEHSIALSGLEYDKYADRLFLLTSFEEEDTHGEVTDETIGGYLWYLHINELNNQLPPVLVLKQDGVTPLLFAHKSEGVTVINSQRIIVIHDDDRILGRSIVVDPETQFSRKENQAAYTIVDFTN